LRTFHLGNIFQFPTLVGFSLQSFFPRSRSGESLLIPFPLSRFSAPERFDPAIEAVLRSPADWAGAEPHALLGLWVSRALPSQRSMGKASRSLHSPPVLGRRESRDSRFPKPQGISPSALRHFPQGGRRPV
jgi:hypothetical protein